MVRRRSWLSPLKALAVIVFGIWGFGVLTGAYLSSRRSDPIPQVAPLVKQIQQLGQLHTVRFNVHDIYQHERVVEPDGWLSSIPGVSGLYHATTKNSALVVAEGGVEAGIDLSRLSAADVARVATPEGIKLRVKLPPAMIYPPDVQVRVVNQHPGIFWKDDNLIPEATEVVRERFASAAQKSDIIALAQTNAVKTLAGMQGLIGDRQIEFYF